jgi:hypothetical protein
MAVIHQTTLVPSKLELLADWLPQSVSDVTDPTVVTSVAGTDLAEGNLIIIRRLEPSHSESPHDGDGMAGYIEAGWRLPDGSPVRGRLALVHDPVNASALGR